MKRQCWVLGILTLLATQGCNPREPSPWTLMELGTRPVREAWDKGEALVLVAGDGAKDGNEPWPVVLFPDSSLDSRILRREIFSMPSIACGDRMRMHWSSLPLAIREAVPGPHSDSIVIKWHCMDRRKLAAFAAQQVALSAHPNQIESQWIASLRLGYPEEFEAPERTYREDETVFLEIATHRPDGSEIGDTVRLTFQFGQSDQVVPALEPFLLEAGPGCKASIWAPSADAFGQEAHPEFGLPAHTPVQFVVKAN